MGGGEGGTGATGSGDISRGQITGFGSIFVNGVEFETTDSSISLDGASGTESDLKLGMVVTVTGTINPDRLTGKADTVSVEEVIQGLVQANDNVNTLTVLNHTVELPSNVRFDGAGVTDITDITAMTDYVEVSGYVIADGVISATRVERLGSSESGIFGTVSSHNGGDQTFIIGSVLTVHYSGAELSDFPNNQITNGLYVEVEGIFDTNSRVLTADKVEHARISENDVDEMEIEGFVTNVDELPSKFVLNDVPVQLDASTEFEGGSVDEIIVGMFIEVDGPYINGSLHAQEIVFDDTIRIKGEVASLGTDSMTMAGMSGLTIRTDNLTDYGSALPGGFADLAQGTRIRIRGFQQNNTAVVARRIDTESSGADASLQGKVTAESSPGVIFAINGVAIDTSSNPSMVFIVDGEIKNSTEFFSSLDVGEDVVEAKGVLSGSVITWESVELM
jgi:hypothetical protein